MAKNYQNDSDSIYRLFMILKLMVITVRAKPMQYRPAGSKR